MIESLRKCFCASGTVGTVLIGISMAYDCIVNDLLIAKFEANNFDRSSLKFMYSYLKGRGQKIKIGSSKQFPWYSRLFVEI